MSMHSEEEPVAAAEEMPRSSKPWSRLLRVFLGIAILGALAASGRLDLGMLLRVEFGTRMVLLILASLVMLAANSLRWACLAESMHRAQKPMKRVLVSLASNVFSPISPAGAGADIARISHLLKVEQFTLKQALTVGLIDRLTGLQTLLLVTTCLGLFSQESRGGLWSGLALATVATTVVLLGLIVPATAHLALRCLPRSWRAKWERDTRPRSFRWILLGYGCSIIGTVTVVLPILGAMALDPELSRPTQYFSSALVVLVNIVAPTPGGMGIGEAAASRLLEHSGSGGGAECMFLARLVIISWSLLMGACYLVDTGNRPITHS